MSASSRADDADIVAVMSDRGRDGAALQAEALDEAAADVAVDAMARDDRDLDDVLRRGRSAHRPSRAGSVKRRCSVMILPGMTPITGVAPRACRDAEIVGRTRASPSRCRGRRARTAAARSKKLLVRRAGRRAIDVGDRAVFEVVEEHDVGALARARSCRGRVSPNACARGQRAPRGRRRAASQPSPISVRIMKSRWPSSAMSSGLRSSVQSAKNGDVATVSSGRQRVQVLRDRAFADQHRHALADLLERFLGASSSRGRCGCRRTDSR